MGGTKKTYMEVLDFLYRDLLLGDRREVTSILLSARDQPRYLITGQRILSRDSESRAWVSKGLNLL